MARLSPAGKQLVEICRAVAHGSSLLIFDEPTSSLSGGRDQGSLPHRRTLREREIGVIYITHRLEELRSVGDRVTILRDGATVHTGSLSGDSRRDRIIQHMVGRDGDRRLSARIVPPGDELLRVEKLIRAASCTKSLSLCAPARSWAWPG